MLRRLGVFDRQRGYLFNWTPVAYGAGIACYFALPSEPDQLAWTLLSAALAIGVVFGWLVPRLRRWPLFVALLIAVAGICVAGLRSYDVAAPKLDWRYYGPIEGRIVKIDRSQSDAVRLTLDQVRLIDIAPDDLPRKVRISLHGRQGFLAPEPGQIIALTGHLSPPAGPVEPGGYDFRRQAWFQGIGAVGYTRIPALLIAPPGELGFGLWIQTVRHKVSLHVRDRLPGPTGGFATAITTGDRSAIARETLEDLRATNLAHLLAISGLHMGLLTGVVFAALRGGFALWPRLALTRPVKKWAAIGALIAGGIYLSLSGGNVATERAFIMVSVMFVAVLLDRRAITLRAVAVAALIVLTLRPEALYGPGFQMSFAATTALVAVYGALRDYGFRRASAFPAWAGWIGGVALSSLVAGLATAPIAAAHFNQVPHYGLVANVLSVPVMGVLIMPSAVLAAVLWPIGLDGIGFWLMEQGILWILMVAEFVADWPGVVSRVPAPPPMVLPILALAAVWIVLWKGPWRSAGVVGMAFAFSTWATADRPAVLVSETGRLVGFMTANGRALSKPNGDGFAARVWLENDGDAQDQGLAAARWGGDIRVGVWRIAHVTGRDAANRASALCPQYDLTIVSADVDGVDCQMITQEDLRRSGAVALFAEAGGGLKMVTVAETTGRRPWSE